MKYAELKGLLFEQLKMISSYYASNRTGRKVQGLYLIFNYLE